MQSPATCFVSNQNGVSFRDYLLFAPDHFHYVDALGVKHVINNVTLQSSFIQNGILEDDGGGFKAVNFLKPYANMECICTGHEEALAMKCQNDLCVGTRAFDARVRTFDIVRRYADGSMSREEIVRLAGVVNELVQVYKRSCRALCEPVDELLASQMHMSFSAGTGKWFTVAEVTECYMQHNRAVPVPSETWRGFE